MIRRITTPPRSRVMRHRSWHGKVELRHQVPDTSAASRRRGATIDGSTRIRTYRTKISPRRSSGANMSRTEGITWPTSKATRSCCRRTGKRDPSTSSPPPRKIRFRLAQKMPRSGTGGYRQMTRAYGPRLLSGLFHPNPSRCCQELQNNHERRRTQAQPFTNIKKCPGHDPEPTDR